MSTAVAESRTIFESPPARYLDLDSNGMRMSRREFNSVEDCDERYRYELIQGVVVVSPPPLEGERGPNGRLDQWLWNYHDRHPQGHALDGTLFEQEIDTGVCIRRADRVIWARLGRQPNPRKDIPAIVIEFVSKAHRDRRRDYQEKRREYAAIGVKEYWIIDRFRRTMTVCRGNRRSKVVREHETYTTDLLPGFELRLSELLAVADRWSETE